MLVGSKKSKMRGKQTQNRKKMKFKKNISCRGIFFILFFLFFGWADVMAEEITLFLLFLFVYRLLLFHRNKCDSRLFIFHFSCSLYLRICEFYRRHFSAHRSSVHRVPQTRKTTIARRAIQMRCITCRIEAIGRNRHANNERKRHFVNFRCAAQGRVSFSVIYFLCERHIR